MNWRCFFKAVFSAAIFGAASANLVLLAANVYFPSWIDFNKNGKLDVYEDRCQPLNLRVEDLLQRMSVEEKTCQLATLYEMTVMVGSSSANIYSSLSFQIQ